MNFSNKKVLRTYSTAHSKNAWAFLEGIGWRKIGQTSTDGVTNMYIMANAARASGKPVSGTIDASNMISVLYL